MAYTAGFPLSLEDEVPSGFLVSDSEDESAPPTPREPHEVPKPAMTEDEEDRLQKKTENAAANVPLHPIPAMQSAFAESLFESTINSAAQKPKLRFGDAKERRAQLLGTAKDSSLHTALWRYRPGQKHHELWKLMGQISFGVYLLLNGIANSNIQVVNILQGHIDEVDEFLEVTMEDVNLAIDDVHERIGFLKLPMSNIPTFEKMLEDRAFRLQIVTGNEKIEHIVNRTGAALEATLKDVEEGLKATREFAVYLGDQQHQPWRAQRPDVSDIFDAMKGNTEGWYKAFVDLQESTSALDTLLTRLDQMVSEMDRRAGEVSRKTRFSVEPFSGPTAGASRNSDVSWKSSSRRSLSSGGRSEVNSVAQSEHPSTTISSPSQNSPPSPSARDTLPDFQYKSPPKRVSIMRRVPSLEIETITTRRESRVRKVPSLEIVTMAPKRESRLRKVPSLEIETATARRESMMKKVPSLEIDTGIPKRESMTRKVPTLEIDTAVATQNQNQMARPSPIEEEGLYILQPRTYTPLPPEPLPSPMVHDHPSPKAKEQPEEASVPKRPSLRQRLSLKGNNPPEAIQVPPRNPQRPKYQSPRVYQGPDSAYGSDIEARRFPQSAAITDVYTDLRPAYPNTIPSPLSDQPRFRPVQASPHSPLQQRPWTSGTAQPRRPHTSATHHQGRHLPSAMGMSTLSNVTTLNSENKRLKKKKSAFGWLKKAFQLDEEERAAFEARKAQQTPNLYYDSRSPKFLDGKRREEHNKRY